MNHDIKEESFLLVSETGQALGQKTLQEALDLLKENQNLVQVKAADDKPAVCRIEAHVTVTPSELFAQKRMKESESSKSKKAITLKNIEISSGISDHDLDTKIRQVRKMFEKNNHVQFKFMNRGTGNHVDSMKKTLSMLEDVARVTKAPVKTGKRLLVYMMPSSKKQKPSPITPTPTVSKDDANKT
jgi:translation initiation factor IF-3